MKYNTNIAAVEMTLCELCSRAYLAGDIGGYAQNNPWDTVYQKGDIYNEIQSDYISNGVKYEQKVPLQSTTLYGGICYYITATADGIIKEDGKICIDEISPVRSFEFSQKPLTKHFAHLKCLAYFYASSIECEKITIRLIRYNIDNDKIKYYEHNFSVDELRLYFYSLLEKVAKWAVLCVRHQNEALPGMAAVKFPYTQVREAQSEMIKACYSALFYNRRLFASAPTGTGKTMASLYPAVVSMGEGRIDKIFYLTAKSSTRREAFSAVSKLFRAGAKLRGIIISAKEQMCLCPKAKGVKSVSKLCNPYDCDYARGYYDRVEGAIFDLLMTQNGYNRDVILRVAKKHCICPYEFSLDMSELCDIIICDYNYIFDPCVYFRRYFSDSAKEKPRCTFLIDESHNLPSRLRDMYSVELNRVDFEKVYAKIYKNDIELNPIFEKIIISMRDFKKLCHDTLVRHEDGSLSGYYLSGNLYSGFGRDVSIFEKDAGNWLKSNKEHPLTAEIEECVDKASKYILIEEMYDTRFLTYIEYTDKNSKIKLFCIDPSYVCDLCLNRANSAMLFSATLTPLDYFMDLLGGAKGAKSVSLPSPFERDNLAVIIASDVSTKYEERNVKTYRRSASVIAGTVSGKAGNYIAYFPSYEFMDLVYKEFKRKYPSVETIVQERHMSASQKDEFLDFFKADTGVLRIGFCVLGGSFSEGIDLPESRLIGVIIFGVGIPAISSERNILRDYYENKNECGYDYAYTYPGMNNVLQAAGRVIRTEHDKGVVVLADSRYTEEKYKVLFPDYWENIRVADNPQKIALFCHEFWNK